MALSFLIRWKPTFVASTLKVRNTQYKHADPMWRASMPKEQFNKMSR